MDLGQATDELLAAPWDAFVETRARLAEELARAGKRDDSRALKKIRRPTAAAWATNQVVRRARAAVDAYLAASDHLRARQTAMLAGARDREAYQAAAESFRQATASLSEAARKVLHEGGREPDRGQIEAVVANVRAAALADERRDELLAGRLLADFPAAEGGLEGLFGASLAAGAAATAPVARPAAHGPSAKANSGGHAAGRGREAEAHARRDAEARARREEHARRLSAAEEEERTAAQAAAGAAAALDQARADRDAADGRVRDAEAAVVTARRAAQEAAAALRAAEHAAKESDAASRRATSQRERLEKDRPA